MGLKPFDLRLTSAERSATKDLFAIELHLLLFGYCRFVVRYLDKLWGGGSASCEKRIVCQTEAPGKTRLVVALTHVGSATMRTW